MRHGTDPPSKEEIVDSVKKNMEKMTPKDWAALDVRLAEGDVACLQNFRRTEMELIEAKEALRKSERKYHETPGEETPRVESLREKICEVLDRDKTKVWLVRDLATLLGHPANHVGVVVSFLRKDKKKKWNVK
ncbi:MAG: hypothetical protein R3B55_00435 [Candidatus Paceibacterota bacterium]